MIDALTALAAVQALFGTSFDPELQRDALVKAKAEAEAATRAWLGSP
jgi:hypothetical protein